MSNPMMKAVSSDGLLLRQGAKGGVGGGGGGDAGHGGDRLPLLLLLLAARCYQRVLNCSIGRPLGRNLGIWRYYWGQWFSILIYEFSLVITCCHRCKNYWGSAAFAIIDVR